VHFCVKSYDKTLAVTKITRKVYMIIVFRMEDSTKPYCRLIMWLDIGTESETKEFMAVCVETVNKYPLNDFVSPVFIFERLCSIIFPVRHMFADVTWCSSVAHANLQYCYHCPHHHRH